MRDLDLRVIRVGGIYLERDEAQERKIRLFFCSISSWNWRRREMKVIFCTPTATLLVWITERYPEILNCDINGVSYQDGERRR